MTALPDISARAFQVFAYYHWWSILQKNPSLKGDTTCITIKNASLESSLMPIRDPDDFFWSKKGKPDDLSATDYGFAEGRGFLTVDEREIINKKLAHLTVRAAEEIRANPTGLNPRTWNNAELVERAMVPLLEFLDHIEQKFLQSTEVEFSGVHLTRKCIEAMLRNIRAIAQSEMEFGT